MTWERLKDAIKFTVWIPGTLHQACKEAAEDDGRSLSNWVRWTLERAIRKTKP